MSARCRKCGRTQESLLCTALLKGLGCFVSGPPEDKCAKDWKAHDWDDEPAKPTTDAVGPK